MNLKEVKGIGDKSLHLLKKLGIESEESLIEYYPYRYHFIKRSDLENLVDDKIIVDGVVETIPKIFYIHKNLNKLSFS